MKKNILIFAHDSSLYGASLSLITILNYLSQDESFDVMVLLPYGGLLEQKLKNIKIRYKIISFPKCFTKQSNNGIKFYKVILNYYIKEYKIMPILKAIARQFKPDVIYTNTSVISVGYKLAGKLQIPHIWHIREFGNINSSGRYIPLRTLIAHKIRNSYTSIFTTSLLRDHWIKSQKEKYKVVYNGFEQVSKNNTLNRIPNDTYKFGLLGMLIPIKGQDIAIKGFAQFFKHYKNSELHFYGNKGDENYYDILKNLAQESGCSENIYFHPYNSDINLIYKNINVLLNCSVSEGFGRTLVEAMIRGIPVIANSSSGGPREIIDDGVNGLLYTNTPDSLKEKMNLLSSTQGLYAKISNNAIIKAHKEFSEEKYVHRIRSILINATEKSRV